MPYNLLLHVTPSDSNKTVPIYFPKSLIDAHKNELENMIITLSDGTALTFFVERFPGVGEPTGVIYIKMPNIDSTPLPVTVDFGTTPAYHDQTILPVYYDTSIASSIVVGGSYVPSATVITAGTTNVIRLYNSNAGANTYTASFVFPNAFDPSDGFTFRTFIAPHHTNRNIWFGLKFITPTTDYTYAGLHFGPSTSYSGYNAMSVQKFFGLNNMTPSASPFSDFVIRGYGTLYLVEMKLFEQNMYITITPQDKSVALRTTIGGVDVANTTAQLVVMLQNYYSNAELYFHSGIVTFANAAHTTFAIGDISSGVTLGDGTILITTVEGKGVI